MSSKLPLISSAVMKATGCGMIIFFLMTNHDCFASYHMYIDFLFPLYFPSGKHMFVSITVLIVLLVILFL